MGGSNIADARPMVSGGAGRCQSLPSMVMLLVTLENTIWRLSSEDEYSPGPGG